MENQNRPAEPRQLLDHMHVVTQQRVFHMHDGGSVEHDHDYSEPDSKLLILYGPKSDWSPTGRLEPCGRCGQKDRVSEIRVNFDTFIEIAPEILEKIELPVCHDCVNSLDSDLGLQLWIANQLLGKVTGTTEFWEQVAGVSVEHMGLILAEFIKMLDRWKLAADEEEAEEAEL